MQEMDEEVLSSDLRISPWILKLTWEDKIKICEEWKASGLSKERFCKQKGVAIGTFYGWCQKLWPSKRFPRGGFREVKIIDKAEPSMKVEAIVLEVSFPNAVVARIKATEMQFSFLLRELLDETKVIR